MDIYFILKWLHILGATVLFGLGAGTAYYMWMAHLGRDPALIAAVGRMVVRADWIFTLGSGIAQPLTGAALILVTGYDPLESWLLLTYGLYSVALGCWVPVVGLQIRAQRLAAEAAAAGGPLDARYERCMRWWFILGWLAFLSLLMVFWLMVAKPDL